MAKNPILREPVDFEVHTPDGRVFRVGANGITEGFPDGSILINRLAPKIHATLGLLTQATACGDVPEELHSQLAAIWQGAL